MKNISSIALLLAVIFTCCEKADDKTAVSSGLSGKWILVETLADPGDGSGQWTPVDKPGNFFLRFNDDNSVKSNVYTGLGGLKQYAVVNDSTLKLIYADGHTPSYWYKIDGQTLTIRGGCIEACGSRFTRANP